MTTNPGRVHASTGEEVAEGFVYVLEVINIYNALAVITLVTWVHIFAAHSGFTEAWIFVFHNYIDRLNSANTLTFITP